jgi:branched-chain amino acid transport system permease protein
MMRDSRTKVFISLVLLAACWTGLLVRGSVFTLAEADQVLTAVPAALALTLLTGRTGQVSLAQGALLALGGFCAGIMGGFWNVPFIVVLISAMVIGGAAGLIASLPAFRLGGFYLALSTLTLYYVVAYALQSLQDAGPEQLVGYGVPQAEVGIALTTEADWYVALSVIVAICVAAIVRMFRSDIGRAWSAISHNELAASITGIEISKYKMAAFAISSALVSLSGALSAYQIGRVTIDQYTLGMAITYYAMVVIGGIGSITGAIVGATLVTLLPYWTGNIAALLPQQLPFAQSLNDNIGYTSDLVVSLITIVVLIVAPKGLVGLGSSVVRRIRNSRMRGSAVCGASQQTTEKVKGRA